MSNRSNEFVVFSRGGINAKTVASTVIDTTEDGTRRFVPVMVTVESTASNTVTGGIIASVGTNSATYNNILASKTFDPFTTNQLDCVQCSGLLSSVAPNTDIRINITTGATGTSETMRVDIIGYYI